MTIIIIGNSSAQPGIEWDHTYGGQGYEELQAMCYTQDEGYLVAGMTSTEALSGEILLLGPGDGYPDGWLLKLDINGDMVWQSRFGCHGTERVWDIYPNVDGTFFMLVTSSSDICADKSENSRGGKDFWLIKIDQFGNKIWDRTYGGEGDDIGRKIIALPTGELILAGYSESSISGERTAVNRGEFDYWLIKINPDGDKIADYAYGGNQNDWLYDFAVKEDGSILLGGWSNSNQGIGKSQDPFGANDFWLVHILADGTLLGDYQYGGASQDVIQEVIVTKDGNVLMVGESNSSPNTGNKTSQKFGINELTDFWVVKLNEDFSIQWQHTFGGNAKDFPHVIWENKSGRLWICGDTESPPSGNKENPLIGGKDLWMLLLEPDGTRIWEQSYGGFGNEAPEELLLAHDGGYILGAHSSSDANVWKSQNSRGLNDFWIVKTNCSLSSIDIDIETNVCAGEEFPLAPQWDDCDDCDYMWLDGTEDTIRIISIQEDTEYDILVSDANGCEEESIVQAFVQSDPQIHQVNHQDPSCNDYEDGHLILLEVTSGIEPYRYSLDGENYSENYEFYDLPSGDYTLFVIDDFGCKDDTIIYLNNPSEPLIEIGIDTTITLGDTLYLDVLVSPGVDTFIWDHPSLLECPDCYTQIIRPTETTLYSVTAYNEVGCFVHNRRLVSVKSTFPYFAPTAFSPNLDSFNELYRIYSSKSVIHIKNFRIYNRWGGLMYQKPELHLTDVRQGWNGLHRGKKASTGAYFWSANITYIDGYTEQIFGDFTLVR